MRRSWRTFQILCPCSAATLVLHYADNRIAYLLNATTSVAYYVGPDPSTTAVTGYYVAAGAGFQSFWMMGQEVEMPVWVFNPSQDTAFTMTVAEYIQEKADEKQELD